MDATKVLDKKKTLAPKLRFTEFDEGSKDSSYKKYFFNDIFLFSTGKNIKQNEASPQFETPCVRYGELYHMYNEVINEVFNRTNINKSDLHFSQGDEILLPSAGEDPLDIGSASALTLKNVAIGRTINILKPLKANIYSQIYAAYYINQKLRRKISTLAKGVSISNVYNSDLKTLEIILPNLPEQQKIASFLSAVDEKIQQLTRKKELHEQYKKGAMQQLFSGKLRFKDENGKVFPMWEEKKLWEISEKKSSNIAANAISENVGDYKIYGATGFLKTVDFYKEDEPYISIVKDGAGVGRTLLCDANTSVLGTLDIIKPTVNVDLYFLYSVLNKIDFVKYTKGSTIPHIYFKDYSTEKINLPCLEEQKKIANFLASIDSKIENINKQITQTQTFKKGLLQQMFV